MTDQIPPVSPAPPTPAPVPPAPPPMAPSPAAVPVAPGDRRGLAIASLVLGILGINSRGKGMAIAGIILGAVGLLLTIVFRIIFRGAFLNNIWQQILNGV